MKTKLSLLILIMLLAATVQAQSAPDPSSWKRYTVKDEEFSVTLPTVPAMVSNKTYSRRLQKERRERFISTSVDGVTYSINTYDNPKRQLSFEDFIAEGTAALGLDASTGRDLTLNGFPGKEYSYRGDVKTGVEQFFATEQRLYRFSVRGASETHPGAKQFFASIMLGKKQDGIQVADGPGVPLGRSIEPGEKIYVGRDVDQKARITKYPPPDYTDAAKAKGVTGVVVLKVVFAANGTVTNISAISGLPLGLTEKAIEAARKIKFIPAMKDGKFVHVWMQLEYNFNLY